MLAALAGACRTDTAFVWMLAETRAADALVNPDYGNGSALDWREVAKLPMVAQAGVEHGITVIPVARAPGPPRFGSRARPRRPHGNRVRATTRAARTCTGWMPWHEVLVNPELATHYGVGVGDDISAMIVSPADFERLDASGATLEQSLALVNRGDEGTPVRLRVTGIGVSPEEVVLDEGFEERVILATPAFFRRYPQAGAGFFGVGVRLRHGAADLAAFKRECRRCRIRARSSSSSTWRRRPRSDRPSNRASAC